MRRRGGAKPVIYSTVEVMVDVRPGGLRFPEYGPHLYRPEAGAALIFSCSHLHEVLNVTAGRRFVLLSFLFGEHDRDG